MKKITLLFFILLFFSMSFHINSQTFSINDLSIKLFLGSGINYNLPVRSDYTSREETFFLEIPLEISVDFRNNDWYSIITGISFNYGLHIQRSTYNDLSLDHYFHNMFIKLPVSVKFYPFINRHRMFYNFYLGIGGFLHFWPVNMYYNISNLSERHSGDRYNPVHDEMEPGNVYTPVNIGFKFSLGNHFYVSSRTLLGFELNTQYLFIPYINGYYYGLNYNRGFDTILEFGLSFGAIFSIGFDLK